VNANVAQAGGFLSAMSYKGRAGDDREHDRVVVQRAPKLQLKGLGTSVSRTESFRK
jgi:hypothetical protein